MPPRPLIGEGYRSTFRPNLATRVTTSVLVGPDDFEVLVDEDVVRPVDADVVDPCGWSGPSVRTHLSHPSPRHGARSRMIDRIWRAPLGLQAVARERRRPVRAARLGSGAAT